MDPGNSDVGEALDAVLERPRANRRLLGNGEVARAGRANEDRAPPRGRRFRIWREIGRPPELVDLHARKAGRECLGLRCVSARREKAAAGGLEPFRDRHDLADGLARTKNHLLMPLRDGPEVIDRREGQGLELQAADLADPYR